MDQEVFGYLDAFGEFIQALMAIIHAALTLNPDAFQAVYQGDVARQLALAVLLLAGVSQAAGQSVTLFLNRVSPGRFVFSLLLSALFFVGGVFFWTLTIWVINRLLFDFDRPFREIFWGVSLGQAPLIFGFLVLIPWLGLVIRRILQVWTLLAVTVALLTAQLQFWQILASVLVGWFVLEIVYKLMGRPIALMSRVVWYWQTGRRQKLSLREINAVLLHGEELAWQENQP